MPLARSPGDPNAPMPVEPHRLLIVEDEPAMARALSRVLARRGYGVTTATTVREATRVSGRFDCAVLDIDLPDGSGLDVAHHLLDAGRVHSIVFFSASEDPEVRLQASKLGIFVHKANGIHELGVRIAETVAEAIALAAGAEGQTVARRGLKSGLRRKR